MANYQHDNRRRQSAIQNLLSMFHLANTPTVSTKSDEEGDEDVDEPPDKPSLQSRIDLPGVQQQPQTTYTRSTLPVLRRKESLLTQALMTSPIADGHSAIPAPVTGPLSRASTLSNASMLSAAELTSDAGDTSPARSATPSPPLPSPHYHSLHASDHTPHAPSSISLVTSKEQKKPVAADLEESNVEANLGRRRCITFACAGKPAAKEPAPVKQEKVEPPHPPRRKCMLTFACPARPTQTSDQSLELPTLRRESASPSVKDSAVPAIDRETVEEQGRAQLQDISTNFHGKQVHSQVSPARATQTVDKPSQAASFHEFETSSDHQDAWIHEPIDSHHKLTLSDCLKKENVIRKIGQEAEEEAEEEEKDDELEDENEEGDNEDDFAPSDDGNESDNEAGFAESDDENSDAGSDDQFWAPSNTTAATSVDQVSPIHAVGARLQSGSSMDSLSDHKMRLTKASGSVDIKYYKHRRPSKINQVRQSTPELPDSTDFVCGTLDEDRPLEAAYISVKEQKKREKHIPIPQDIDPSFPTTDPEDMDEEDDEDLDVAGDHLWLKDQLEGFEDDSTRGNASKHSRPRSTRSPSRRPHSPPAKPGVLRSPPPPRQPTRRASPALKGRLFGHSPKPLHLLPPPMRLRSPPGTRRHSPSGDRSPMTNERQCLVISRLAQRPHMTRTSSLPRTPNPFFHNYHARTQQNDRVAFGAATPGRDMHVRGPVDIVIGLEKKRQKRKEKFWRQHCRKAAKEQAERRTIPGRGAERMRELGLECAERTRGYGLGQQPPLVISL